MTPDLSPATTLLFVRHGRTPLTREHRLSGSSGSDPDLSAEGQQDAAAVAAFLARATDQGGPWEQLGRVSAVLCSPMRRTRSTARIIAEALGPEPVVDDRWAELDFGQWEGLTYGEVMAKDPERLSHWLGSGEGGPPGGESLEHLCLRVSDAFGAAVQDLAGRTAVVVAHVTPIRAVVRQVLDAGPVALRRLRVDPCSVTVVRAWSDGGTELFTTNHVANRADVA